MFTVKASPSSKIATVGVVEWSTDLANVSSARIVYALSNPAAGVRNTGGIAPVDAAKASNRTLLLGLKPSSAYTYHIEATSSSGASCKSSDQMLTTGTLSGAPSIMRNAMNASAQANGFIITSGGVSMGAGGGNQPVFIIDADGAVVWSMPAPASCSRARMSYEGTDMWMLALNVQNTGGEMRRVSMDGLDVENNASGLSRSHHDFTVRRGGIVATMAWVSSGTDPESDLIERAPDGTLTTVARLGPEVYNGGKSVIGGGTNTYHPNNILYHEADDSYTVGDRNPHLFVKISRTTGKPIWQMGGSCTGAPAPKCAAGTWEVNHGHQLLKNGNILIFNNGPFGQSSTPSRVLEFSLSESGSALTATSVHTYTPSTNSHTDSLGDVQRLPNGNTLVTFSNNGLIQELDPSWNLVQTLTSKSFGYTEWRETLYGPPQR
jgi:hypothetical protein